VQARFPRTTGWFARQCRKDEFHHKQQTRARYIQLSECRMASAHQHDGLTPGVASGRLLAEMMTGETRFADIRPFAAGRFG